MGEILLGAKRPPRSRRVAKKLAIATLILVVGAVVAYVVFRRATRYTVPKGVVPVDALASTGTRLTLGSSSLERRGPIWVLRVEGDPYTIGAAQGRLLADAAASGDRVLDATILGEHPPAGWISGTRHDASLRWKFRLLADGIPEPHRREIAGLAAGLAAARVKGAPDYQRLIWRQAALDVGKPPGHDAPMGGVSSGLAFALGGGTNPAERAILARTFSLPGAASPPGDVVVTFVKKTGAIPFARVGWAGQVGVVTGVNAEGIAIALNPAIADDVRATKSAEPLSLVARDVLEQARTIDEALALLKDAKVLGAASFLVVDGKARAWGVIERSPGRFAVQRPPKPPVLGDLLGATEFVKDAENDRARRTRPGLARTTRLGDLLVRPVAVEPASAAALLRDRQGRGDGPLPLGNGNAVDPLDAAHVVVIDATSLTLWVGEGPGAAGPLQAFDLRHELGGEPPRAGSPLPMAADPSLDSAAAAHLSHARRELRAAHALARRGKLVAASEAAARARALAPELAEVHKLSGDLARENGDDAGARAHYRRFLELAPADPGAIQDARAALGTP